MCKPFPQPLVRGGIFLVGLETKYRDIADGNVYTIEHQLIQWRELETKYRDIADGNRYCRSAKDCSFSVGNQVPRYSGYKSISAREQFLHVRQFAHTMTNKIKNGVRVITRTPFFG